jgi:hypothetical protein
MFRLRFTSFFLLVLLLAAPLTAQKTGTKPAAKTQAKDIDPLSLNVLRAVTQPIEKAQNFTFKALVSEEEVASNGQIVTFFRAVDIRVQRPNKVHLIYKGRGDRVDFFNNGTGTVTLYSPESKLYGTVPGKTTIEETLNNLDDKGFDMPVAPFLRSDIYKLATANLITGYVIGRVKIFDEDVHQLAFTAPDADLQLWVTGGEAPRIVRAELVNKKLEGQPRTTVQFLDWNLNPNFSSDEFTFTKPEDAHQIEIKPMTGGK